MVEAGSDLYNSFGPTFLIQQGHRGETAQDDVPGQSALVGTHPKKCFLTFR